jgi:hypothetical protein
MNILILVWNPMFSRDSYACRPKMGIHSASLRAMQFIRRNRYYLQCDVRKFYPSINHETMMKIIRHKVRDEKILAIIQNIINSLGDETNLPIGNYCSQWFGNLYLNELDTFVKKELGCRDFLRYSDDFCLFSDDKKLLGHWREKIRVFLLEKLQLTYSFAEIAQVSAGIDFLGYRHFPDKILMRKSTMKRMRRRIRKFAAMPVKNLSADNIRGSVASMNGWLSHAAGNDKLKRQIDKMRGLQ